MMSIERFRYRPNLELLEDRLAPAGDAFIEPPAIESVNGVLHATLVLQQGAAMVGDTAVTNAWTYHVNGVPSYVGPTLKVRPGDLLDIQYINQLPAGQTTNLHVHGFHVSPVGNSDNVLLAIEPGEDNHFKIQLPADHPEGLYWYHPHHHGTVNSQISMGLSGLIAIGDVDFNAGGGSPLLDGLTQHLVALKNALLDGDQIIVPPLLDQMAANQTFTVNGQLVPELDIPVGRYDVFNIANIGNNAFFTLSVFDETAGMTVGSPWTVIGRDGNPYVNAEGGGLGASPPGRRWSTVLTPRIVGGNAVAGTYILRTNGFDDGDTTWPAKDLMRINFVGAPIMPAPPAPVMVGQAMDAPNQNFVDLRSVPADQIAAIRQVVFDEAGNIFTINGEQFPNNPTFQPRLNTVEEWWLSNPSINDHPFHLHVNPQQVVQGGPNNPTGLSVYQDVVNVPKGTTAASPIKIRIQFLDFLGEFVYHCHRVDHEDLGMMALTNIIPEAPIYAVGANAQADPLVKVFNPFSPTPDVPIVQFNAFPPTFRGGVNVSVADVNGDGVYDVIVAKASKKTQVRVIDGTKLDLLPPTSGNIPAAALLGSFLAYHGTDASGAFVTGGYYDGDDKADVITGPGRGSPPVVKVVNVGKLNGVDKPINQAALLDSFLAFGTNFLGGVRVAVDDIQGDGRFDIVAGKGPGSDPRVKVFTGLDNALIANFLAYEESFRGGVYVGTGNVTGTAFADIITGRGEGGDSLVKVFANIFEEGMMAHGRSHGGHDVHTQAAMPLDLEEICCFLAYGPGYTGGVRVTSLQTQNSVTDMSGTFDYSIDDIVTTRATGDGTNPSRFPLPVGCMCD